MAVAIALTCSAAAAGDLVRHTLQADDGHPLTVWAHPLASPRATLLLLHGRTWSTRPDFDLDVPGEDLSLMTGLAARGIESYGLDQRGYGGTPRDASGWLTPDRAARDTLATAAWLAERKARRVYLLGWSYGALIAHLAAQRDPRHIAGVVLFGYPLRPSVSDDSHTPDSPVRAPTTPEAAASDFITPGAISAKAVDAFVAQALAADPVRADWRRLDEWRELDPAKLTRPLLLIEGEYDPYTQLDAHVDLFTRVSSGDRSWIVLPGADHAAHLEHSQQRFVDAVSAFILAPR